MAAMTGPWLVDDQAEVRTDAQTLGTRLGVWIFIFWSYPALSQKVSWVYWRYN